MAWLAASSLWRSLYSAWILFLIAAEILFQAVDNRDLARLWRTSRYKENNLAQSLLLRGQMTAKSVAGLGNKIHQSIATSHAPSDLPLSEIL